MQTRNLPGCWIYDALVVAWLLDNSIATTSSLFVDVVLEGKLARGTTWGYDPDNLRLDVGIPLPQGRPVKILKLVDNQKLLDVIYHYLSHFH